MEATKLSASFYAARFRELAEKILNPQAATDRGGFTERHNLETTAGELAIEAVELGYLVSIPGATELVANYREAESRYAAGERAGLRDGQCYNFPEPGALRAATPSNLLIDLQAILLHSIYPENSYRQMVVYSDGKEREDFARLAVLEETQCNVTTFRLLADLLEGEDVPDDSEWPTVGQAAQAQGVAPAVISKAIAGGMIKDNGKKRKARRVDPASLISWTLTRIE